jgi:predicted HD superfamily hydrolase involved in NAD metabolism
MIAASTPLTEIIARLQREEDADTFNHSLRTANLARELAEIHGVDPERAEAAALLHDVADRYSDRQLLELAEKYHLNATLTEVRVPKLLHGPVGAEVLRHEWGIVDEELLDAVRSHISGNALMSPLAKVVFLADKLEPGRDRHYGGLAKTREIAQTDLDGAILRLHAWRMTELVDTNRPIHEHLVASRNLLLENVRAGMP